MGKLRNASDRSNASTTSVATGIANKEYFWACELTADKRSEKWHIPDDELEEDDEDYIEHTLVVRSICLGAGAVEKEENILVMESVGEDGEMFKGTIANLTKGVNPMVGSLSLTVDGKSGVTFRLAEGSGPISICGNRLLALSFVDYPEDHDLDASQTDDSRLDETEERMEDLSEEDEEEEEDDEEDESFVEEKAKPKQAAKRKAPAAGAKAKGVKKPKMEEDEDEDEEDEEDDDEEDEESDDDVKVKKAKKDAGKNAAKGKPGKAAQPVKNGKPAKKIKK